MSGEGKHTVDFTPVSKLQHMWSQQLRGVEAVVMGVVGEAPSGPVGTQCTRQQGSDGQGHTFPQMLLQLAQLPLGCKLVDGQG